MFIVLQILQETTKISHFLLLVNYKQFNMKDNLKNQRSYLQLTPPIGQFSLGLQIFKIESTNLLVSDKLKQKKMIKKIQNSNITKPSIFIIKKALLLPSLSSEKQSKFKLAMISSRERHATLQNKKQFYIQQTITEVAECKVYQRKFITMNQPLKPQFAQQNIGVGNKKQKIQILYRKSLNDLRLFYQKMQEIQTNNLKEINRLRKMKTGKQSEAQLDHHLALINNKRQMVNLLIEKQQISRFQHQLEYDEFNISVYSERKQKNYIV